MKTEFTPEEIYEVWSEEIKEKMAKEFDIVYSVAHRIILMYGLKRKFMDNPTGFDFIETSSLAIIIYDNIMNKGIKKTRNIKVVKELIESRRFNPITPYQLSVLDMVIELLTEFEEANNI